MNLSDFEKEKPLNRLNTFGIGGNAAYYIAVDTIELMLNTLNFCNENNLRYCILGKGSNSLFSDRGFNGVVIHNKIDFIDMLEPGIFRVGAGTSFSWLGSYTAKRGWSGLEFASGIPASVGGAIFMNAGANGFETAETLISVDYIDEEGQMVTLQKEEMHFSYRTSPFQEKKGAVVAATFQLKASNTAREKQLSIIRYRKDTQPGSEKSAGCVFRNPPNASAGALIEESRLKGTTIGGAQVSHVHANFIINTSNATASDVNALIAYVQTQVFTKHGLKLESEIRLIPDFFPEEK